MDRKEIESLTQALAAAFEKVTKPMLRTSADTSAPRARRTLTDEERKKKRAAENLGKAQEELRKATDKLAAFTKKQIETTKRGKEAQEKYNEALKEVTEIMAETADKYEEFSNKSLDKQYRAFKDLAKNTQGLSSKLAASQAASSQFAAALLKSYERIETDSEEYRHYLRDIGKSLSQLDKEYLEQAKLIDKTTGALKDNLDPNDIAKLRVQLGQTQTIINENLSKIGVENIAKLTENRDALEQRLSAAASEGLKSGEQFRNSLIVIAEQLEKQGHKLGIDLKDKDKLNYKLLAESIAKLNVATNRAVKGLDVAAYRANTVLGKQYFAFSKGLGDLTKNLLDSGTIIANFNTAYSKTKELYSEIVDFNVAQIPASFVEVQKQSVLLGMSFKDTTKYLDENKRALAIYGQDAFFTITKQFGSTFEKFGYNLKQASEIVGPAFESAIASGINIRDSQKMNEYMNQTMQSFKNISGVVSISAKEYAKLNAELLSSKDSQAIILGMDKERGAAYADQLIALRDNYVQLGLSTQAAQELVKQQEALKREKVTSRVREGAKAMVLAQQAGMSPEEAQELFQLSIKGRAATPQDQKRLQELTTRLAERTEQAQQQAYDTSIGAGMAMQTVTETLAPGGALGQQIQGAAAELAMKQRAGAAMTPEQARAQGEIAKGNQAVAQTSQIINIINSALENKFLGAILSSSLALAGLMAQAYLTARALGAISSIISAPGVPGGGPGGPGGGKLAKLGKGLAGGAVAGIAALGMDMAVDSLKAAGNEKSAAGASIASSALTGAGLGATIGSIIPGVGTAIGAGVGTLAGGAYGLYQNAGAFFKPQKETSVATPISAATPALAVPGIATDVNKPGAAASAASMGILKVTDTGAQDKLAAVIDKMSEAVNLLRLISEQPGITMSSAPAISRNVESSKTTSRSVPTAMEALTGRG